MINLCLSLRGALREEFSLWLSNESSMYCVESFFTCAIEAKDDLKRSEHLIQAIRKCDYATDGLRNRIVVTCILIQHSYSLKY